MTDDEYIKTIPSLSAKELIDELNYCGGDPYYDKIREPIVAEITNRLEKFADLKANFDYVLEGKNLEIKTLGERCNQLLKDKGNLQDTLDNQTVAYETLKLHDQEEIGMLKSTVAELERCFKICEGNADTYYDQLAQAKEIIKTLADDLSMYSGSYQKELLQAEQFLQEIEENEIKDC